MKNSKHHLRRINRALYMAMKAFEFIEVQIKYGLPVVAESIADMVALNTPPAKEFRADKPEPDKRRFRRFCRKEHSKVKKLMREGNGYILGINCSKDPIRYKPGKLEIFVSGNGNIHTADDVNEIIKKMDQGEL